MDVKMQSMIDGLTEITRAVVKDRAMQKWFCGLGQKSPAERRNAVYAMSDKIAALGEPEADLAMAFKLLAIPKVFEAARSVLDECGCSEI